VNTIKKVAIFWVLQYGHKYSIGTLKDKVNHRITEWMNLEGTSGDHLVQQSSSEQGHQKQVHQSCVNLFLNIHKNRDSTIGLGSFLCMTTLIEKQRNK